MTERLFRLKAKKLALTWPRCEATKDLCLIGVKAFFGENLAWAVVAKELHQDGTPHLHAAIMLHVTFETMDSNRLDVIVNQHGNYQTMKNVKNWITYILKDGDYVSYQIDTSRYMDQNKVVMDLVINKSLKQDVIRKFPHWCANNRRKLDDYYYVQNWLKVKTKEEINWNECEPVDLLSPAERLIARWLNQNICEVRRHKQLQLWIFGPPDCGKSTLLMELDRRLRVLWMQKEEDFMDMWEDGSYDLVVIDEFKGQKKLTFLNEFLEGVPLCLRVKGSQRMKRDNVPVIICSNGSPKDCYHNVEERWLEPLLARLTVVELFGPFRIRFFDRDDFPAQNNNE